MKHDLSGIIISMKPYFSIVIPTLNEEQFLPDLLDDLARQTENDFEVIIVDGNSTDNTEKIVLKEKRLKVNLVTVREKNVSVQRNSGAKMAVGNYVFFIDADSRIEPEFLSRARKEINSSKFLIYIPGTVPDIQNPPYGGVFKLVNYAVELSQFTPKPFSNGGTFIIERHFFHHLGGFDSSLKLSEDHEMIQRAKNIGVNAHFLRDVKFTSSLRRLERDGLLDILVKYTISFFYTVTNQRMEKQIFAYDMGGERYSNKKENKTLDEFKKLYLKVMKSLEKTF